MSKRLRYILTHVVLAAVTLLVYAQTADFSFLTYDDQDYVTGNPHVKAGLTVEGIKWAFTAAHASNWIPLTWISHMADVQLFGLAPGMHHMVNVFIHIASVLVLFAALNRMTGTMWPSAFVTSVFAIHPLHVESVAWIAERKDVLSGLFWVLTMWFYARYAERPGVKRYLPVVLALGCGLLSKPMVVTLPVVLLLLDFWPLRRQEPLRKLVVEKLPLMGLAAAAAAVTYLAQQSGGAIIPLDTISMGARATNAFNSYWIYLFQAVWPVRLAAFYPWPTGFPAWEAIVAPAALAAVSLVAWRARNRFPAMFTGWFWYMGTLVPVIGLVQAGNQAHADRYTYLPLIGISIMIAWTVPRRPVVGWICGALVAAFATVGYLQTGYWRDTLTLFRHATEVTDGNYLAWAGLGLAQENSGSFGEAAVSYRKAIEIRPQFPDAQNNLGGLLLKEGKVDEAIPYIAEGVRLQPQSAEGQINYGLALQKKGRFADAQAHYQEASTLAPDNAQAHLGLSAVLEDQGKYAEAIQELKRASAIDPYAPAPHYNLGRLLGILEQPAQAAKEFQEAIRLQPANAATHYNLGIALAQQDQLKAAAAQFIEALRLRPDYPEARKGLAMVNELSDR